MTAVDHVVVVEQVSKIYGKHIALQNVNAKIEKAEIFAFLGPSGAGKTTLVKCIAGVDAASQGNVFVLGRQMPNLEQMRSIGYMGQADALYSELTGKENLEFFAGLYQMKGKKKQNRINEMVELVNLKEDINRRVADYSGGMKRRLSLAISLLHMPKILLLDEPTVGLDPVLRNNVWAELRRLSEIGTTVIVTTHVMSEAEKCDRLGMVRNGKLIAIGTPAELKKQADVATIDDAFLHFSSDK